MNESTGKNINVMHNILTQYNAKIVKNTKSFPGSYFDLITTMSISRK